MGALYELVLAVHGLPKTKLHVSNINNTRNSTKTRPFSYAYRFMCSNAPPCLSVAEAWALFIASSLLAAVAHARTAGIGGNGAAAGVRAGVRSCLCWDAWTGACRGARGGVDGDAGGGEDGGEDASGSGASRLTRGGGASGGGGGGDGVGGVSGGCVRGGGVGSVGRVGGGGGRQAGARGGSAGGGWYSAARIDDSHYQAELELAAMDVNDGAGSADGAEWDGEEGGAERRAPYRVF